MTYEQVINIAIGCVMSSHLDMRAKVDVIDKLREIENLVVVSDDD